MPHLTLSGRVDYYQYNVTAGTQAQATGANLMAIDLKTTSSFSTATI